MMGLGYFSLLTSISISVISAVSGPESLPSIPLKNVKQTNKQQQKQKQNLKKRGQRSNKVFITVHTIEWPNINIGMPVLSAVTWSMCLKTSLT